MGREGSIERGRGAWLRDPRTWLAVFAFCGIGSVSALVSCGREGAGWMVQPALIQHDSIVLQKADEHCDVKIRGLTNQLDKIADLLVRVPQVRASLDEEERRTLAEKQREQARHRVFGRLTVP